MFGVFTDLGHTDISSIFGFEEHDGCPIVRLVLYEAAGCACGCFCEVDRGIHGDVEGVASYNLVQMWSVLHARIHKRVCTLNDELRACKSQHVLPDSRVSESRHSEDDITPMHLGSVSRARDLNDWA